MFYKSIIFALTIYQVSCSFVYAETYKCSFPCFADAKQTCSHYYDRKDPGQFVEDNRWNIYKAQENDDDLLLTRIFFPSENDIPEEIYVDVVHIEKWQNNKYTKYRYNGFCFDNCDECVAGLCIEDCSEILISIL